VTALALIIRLLSLDPAPAARVVSIAAGIPEAAPALIEICHRESRCSRIGLHARDAWTSTRAYRRAVRAGKLHSWCQPPHHSDWGSRGAWGLMAAYHLDALGAPCLPPQVLDIPIVSAWVALDKLADTCAQSAPPSYRARWRGPARRCRWMRKTR